MFARLFSKQPPQAQLKTAHVKPIVGGTQLGRWESTTTVASSCIQSADLKSASTSSTTSLSTSESQVQDEEPVIWASLLFKFGFIFPLLWLFGALILRDPEHLEQVSEVDVETEKRKRWTKSEIERYERTKGEERKWAKRCLWALVTFGVLALIGLAVGLGVGLTRVSPASQVS
ncbi:hypothetical protein L218DRAFT_966986 [Marasmius fiardii PR-910]|nr:hypothetical protein L218DRAFT_966986 [Marasmius fiardii PR-910]